MISINFSMFREDLWIKDGIIQDPMFLFFEQQVKADFKINCHGLIIAPGFIDIHLNGKKMKMCLNKKIIDYNF